MTPSKASVRIEVTATPMISYSLAHNRLPIIDRLVLTNLLNERCTVDVSIELHDAAGVLSKPWTDQVDLIPGQETIRVGVDLVADPSAMLQIEEQRPANIVVRVEAGGVLLGEQSESVQLLAAHQWRAWPMPLAFELLPTFVMPNDPAVTALMSEASMILEAHTGSPSIEGYQSGSDRVDKIVQAICEAMQARRISYSEPPASWADDGQKIRTPSEVLDGRFGTCLDTVVVLAAALEQAGIHPLLWLVTGHAFLGYWREEKSLSTIFQTEVADVVNLIDLEVIGLVETTMLTASAESAPFADLHRPSYASYLSGDLDKVEAVIDVLSARRNHIIPLPARVRTDDGSVQVVEYHPAVHSAPPNVMRLAGVAVSSKAVAAIPPRIQMWKNALLDLSLRNKLINFAERTSIQLAVPDGRLGYLEDLMNAGQAVTLTPMDQLAEVHKGRGSRLGSDLPQDQLDEILTGEGTVFCNVSAAGYVSRMRNQSYKARTIIEETGANNLYLALGSLVWELDGKLLRSPLVLVPINLVTRSRSQIYRIELDDSGGSTPNYCLLEKLRQVHQLEVPGLAVPEEDASGIDLDAALDAMREAVAQAGLPFRVEPTADVSILQFAKFRLWKDLDENWKTFLDNPLVRHLVESPTEPFLDPASDAETEFDLDDLDGLCPVAADASQLLAVAEGIAGRSFVLEGPPGTGKSQTITNLLTRAVAQGGRILFIAEKRAALDVVRKRLDAVGLGPFSLDLHDKGSKPAVVRAQIKGALDHSVSVDEQGLSAQQQQLNSARRSLARYTEHLHERNGAGLSLYSARTKLLALGEDEPGLPVPQSLLTSSSATTLAQFGAMMDSLPETADAARPSQTHPWFFVQLSESDPAHLELVREAVRRVDCAVRAVDIGGPVGALLMSASSPQQLTSVASILQTPVALELLDETRSDAWQHASRTMVEEVAAFVSAVHPGLDVATPEALGLPLVDLHTQAQAAAASSWFGRKKRLRAVLEQLRPALRPGTDVPVNMVLELTAALLQVQGAVHSLATRALGIPGLRLATQWNPLTPDGQELVSRQLTWLSWAGETVDRTASDDEASFPVLLRRYVGSRPSVLEHSIAAVAELAAATSALSTLCQTQLATWQAWSEGAGLLQRWSSTQAGRDTNDTQGRPLQRWLGLLAFLKPLTSAGMGEARTALLTGKIHADDASRALQRGIAQASLIERQQASGLTDFDVEAHERVIQRFTAASFAVRQHMATALPQQVLQSRPFQADSALGQVGALQRELSKQRRGMGVRRLLSTYGDLITQLMPCVLVSPDSLARYFPVGGQMFDTVVFDEASQIRVADAVGAMGRSASAIVVGDSKQMPPTSFAEPAAGSDEEIDINEALAVEDEESILSECVQARVRRHWLSWHYRSKDESLIAFSNEHYYDGRLSSFPAPSASAAGSDIDGYGVSLVRVDGQFHRSGKGRLLRTNPIEAERVVAEMKHRFSASPGCLPSLGVITFNQQQRAYIEALIRDSGDERMIEALDSKEEGLFVKNLENVQGDERDVIFFSTGFSLNDKGVLPLNFGPLNRTGGERRLNVAVTRARRQVVVFSSFDSGQMRTEETSSVGVKHLRAYLELAASGTSALTSSRNRRAVTDRHRDEIASRLRERGFAVRSDVGLSDFRLDLTVALLEDPDRQVLAVLLDGPEWASRRTVGDRDGLPPAVLTGLLEWPGVERVWLPAWLSDPEQVLDKLVAAANEAAIAVRIPGVSAHEGGKGADDTILASAAAFVPAVQPEYIPPVALLAASDPRPSLSSGLAGEMAFHSWVPKRYGGREVLDQLPSQPAAALVGEVLLEGVLNEGPIHVERLAKLVAGAFGISRVTAGRVKEILRQLPVELRPTTADLFAWPSDKQVSTWTDFRGGGDGEARPIEHVSLREIENSMVALTVFAAGMGRDELLRESLAVFGGRRLTAGISGRLDEALQHAVTDGRLLLQDDGLYVHP